MGILVELNSGTATRLFVAIVSIELQFLEYFVSLSDCRPIYNSEMLQVLAH